MIIFNSAFTTIKHYFPSVKIETRSLSFLLGTHAGAWPPRVCKSEEIGLSAWHKDAKDYQLSLDYLLGTTLGRFSFSNAPIVRAIKAIRVSRLIGSFFVIKVEELMGSSYFLAKQGVGVDNYIVCEAGC